MSSMKQCVLIPLVFILFGVVSCTNEGVPVQIQDVRTFVTQIPNARANVDISVSYTPPYVPVTITKSLTSGKWGLATAVQYHTLVGTFGLHVSYQDEASIISQLRALDSRPEDLILILEDRDRNQATVYHILHGHDATVVLEGRVVANFETTAIGTIVLLDVTDADLVQLYPHNAYKLESETTPLQTQPTLSIPKTQPENVSASTPTFTTVSIPTGYRVVNVAVNDALNIRSGPGVSNTISGSIPPTGIGVDVTGPGVLVDDKLWVPILYQGIGGWVNASFLWPVGTRDEAYRVANVAKDDVLNVRSGPGIGNKKVGDIPSNGETVRVIGDSLLVDGSPWVPIEFGDINGWVNKNYLAR